MNSQWQKALESFFETEEFVRLSEFIKQEYRAKTIYPEFVNIFRAFDLTPISQVKVVILGQDPYHGGQANGLAFAVKNRVKIPPSLRNIYKEIEMEFGNDFEETDFGKKRLEMNLENWAKQGVLLLNTILTVVHEKPASHRNIGWEKFTDLVIKKISDNQESVVFMLWGNFAKNKKTLINSQKHLILEAAHPSPLSAYHGFFGCNHFRICNEHLQKTGSKEIVW